MTPLTDAERDELNALLAAGTALPERWLQALPFAGAVVANAEAVKDDHKTGSKLPISKGEIILINLEPICYKSLFLVN